MATPHDNTPTPGNGMDYSEHEKTYAMFNGMLKWGVIICVFILLMMLAFCTPA